MNRAFVVATGIVFAAACSSAGLARLTVEPDTLVINRLGGAMTLPVRATRANGEDVATPLLSITSNSPVVRLWKDGRIGCTRSGDAVVTIAASSITTHATVWCRPNLFLMLAGDSYNETLWTGGPPHDIAVAVTDGGRIVRMPRGAPTARVVDDSVARIVGGRIYGLSRGRSRIELEFNGALGSAPVTVVDRAVRDSVRLVGSQMRTWRMSPGYYEIRLDTTAVNPALELGIYDANCAGAPQHDRQHYFCILKSGSSIIVRNSRPIGPKSELRGELSVLRLPESR